ncbi:TonB-dependent receptor [Rugamonas apoptosis]|uniref:TonB-dependent receptor n=1 Tax=Rugamonas apoptosis TaxID=2758570 RepID=A0A7W2IMQ6_9BURK|nr:TonB-dependent receptor [Rugamonas apoptosis]MBA5690030.1 TonB-dependent receptor [Rugamonas apoptosis]
MQITVTRRLPASQPLVLAAAVSLCFVAAAPALAQTTVGQSLAPIVITGARFDATAGMAPIGATVITADEIRRAGVTDVNAAIRKIGGVYGRNSLDGSPDFGLDLRGFGTNSIQNLVVVVDGVRVSESELSNVILSSIPVDTVERIEISRGGASVLYGEGATGGVINIVTKHPTARGTGGSMTAEVGQFRERELRGTVHQAWDGFAADGAVDLRHNDNYRANNNYKQVDVSAGAQWFSKEGRMGFRYEGAREDMRFAGSLSQAQFDANPRQTMTPNDFGSLDSDRLTGFITRRIGNLDLAAELSHREKTAKSTYVYSFGPSAAEYTSKQTQFSPRLRQLGEVAGLTNELVAGLDLMRWNRVTNASFSQADATQRSKAIYVRDEIKFDPAHNGRLAAGVRRELFDKDFSDPLAFPVGQYNTSQGLNAWELQGSYAVLPALEAFAKAGQSYRVANSDENAYVPTANHPLNAQTSHDLELGASYGDAQRKVTARIFRSNLTNEIFFDPTLNGGYGFNTNLAPTRREGFELDGEARVAPDWTVIGHYQHVKATFREGVNAGHEMVLVPKNIVTVRLAWTPASGQSADIGAQWVDQQRFGDDFRNDCSSQMPSFTTFDARYARKLGQWELSVAGLNLADKHYYSQAFQCRGGIYPSDGRQLKVAARYDF